MTQHESIQDVLSIRVISFMPEAFSFIRTVTSKNRHYDRKDLTIPNFNPRECCHFTVCINKCQGSHSALVSILKLGRRLLITFFEIFQIKYSYVVNSKKVGGRSPNEEPDLYKSIFVSGSKNKKYDHELFSHKSLYSKMNTYSNRGKL